MTKVTNVDLNSLLVHYIGYGSFAIPSRTWDLLDFTKTPTEFDMSRVAAIVKEIDDYEIDWAGKSLADGANEVRRVIAERHPELSDSALAAIEWLFAFEWK